MNRYLLTRASALIVAAVALGLLLWRQVDSEGPDSSDGEETEFPSPPATASAGSPVSDLGDPRRASSLTGVPTGTLAPVFGVLAVSVKGSGRNQATLRLKIRSSANDLIEIAVAERDARDARISLPEGAYTLIEASVGDTPVRELPREFQVLGDRSTSLDLDLRFDVTLLVSRSESVEGTAPILVYRASGSVENDMEKSDLPPAGLALTPLGVVSETGEYIVRDVRRRERYFLHGDGMAYRRVTITQTSPLTVPVIMLPGGELEVRCASTSVASLPSLFLTSHSKGRIGQYVTTRGTPSPTVMRGIPVGEWELEENEVGASIANDKVAGHETFTVSPRGRTTVEVACSEVRAWEVHLAFDSQWRETPANVRVFLSDSSRTVPVMARSAGRHKVGTLQVSACVGERWGVETETMVWGVRLEGRASAGPIRVSVPAPVSGQVQLVDSKDIPVEDALVVLTWDGTGSNRDAFAEPRTIEAGAGGLVRWETAPGRVVVEVRGGDWLPDRRSYVATSDSVDLGVIRLTRGASISVRLSGRSSNEAGNTFLLVRSIERGQWIRAAVPAKGDSVVRGLEAGAYDVEVWESDRLVGERRGVQLGRGADVVLEI
jgi:hypothetical protein